MKLTASLLAVSEVYSVATGLSRGRLGTLVFNDGKAFERISAGGDLNTRSFERAMLWFSSNWPESADWPDNVERPLTPQLFDESTQASPPSEAAV